MAKKVSGRAVEKWEENGCLFESYYQACGNKRCKSCPHGPYYRQVIFIGRGLRRSIYRGKERPTAAPSSVVDDRDFFGKV